jgi:hypothetical protein
MEDLTTPAAPPPEGPPVIVTEIMVTMPPWIDAKTAGKLFANFVDGFDDHFKCEAVMKPSDNPNLTTPIVALKGSAEGQEFELVAETIDKSYISDNAKVTVSYVIGQFEHFWFQAICDYAAMRIAMIAAASAVLQGLGIDIPEGLPEVQE